MQDRPEIFPLHRLSFDQLTIGYLFEAKGLSTILQSDHSQKLINRLYDYDAYLKSIKYDNSIKQLSSYLSNSDRVIYSTENKLPFFTESLYTSHLCACCELFNGISFTEKELNISNISYTINTLLLQKHSIRAESIDRLSSPLHSLDAVRTIQILRSLSLVTVRTSEIRQISLGAGPANKDIYSIHALPRLKKRLNAKNENTYDFKMIPQLAKNIVISDNDPQRLGLYKTLNHDKKQHITALNIDAYSALAKLAELNDTHNIGTRNFIVALRIDHRMLPDIPQLFKLITISMDQSADLIVTIGIGHTIDEFKGRIEKINEIFEFLKTIKLKPTLIKLHNDGTLEQQRNSNSFSLSSITTYQILHCKLKYKILKKII